MGQRYPVRRAVQPSGQMEQSARPALNPVGSQQRYSVAPVRVVASSVGKMTEKFAPPQILIRRDAASQICDVVVLVRGEEMVVRCPSYSQALKWARLECKSYKISEPEIEIISEPEIEPHIPEREIERRNPEQLSDDEIATGSAV